MSDTETAQQEVQLSLNDVRLLHQIVDMASGRGAFQGNELSQVGAIYDKVGAFLNAADAAAKAEADKKEAAAEKTTELTE